MESSSSSSRSSPPRTRTARPCFSTTPHVLSGTPLPSPDQTTNLLLHQVQEVFHLFIPILSRHQEHIGGKKRLKDGGISLNIFWTKLQSTWMIVKEESWTPPSSLTWATCSSSSTPCCFTSFLLNPNSSWSGWGVEGGGGEGVTGGRRGGPGHYSAREMLVLCKLPSIKNPVLTWRLLPPQLRVIFITHSH